MQRAPRPCGKCGKRVYRGGLCADCYKQADLRRGTSTQRGYGKRHRDVFRVGVLERDPICVACGEEPATVADHYPFTRRQLVTAGLDPNDPIHGRGLCESCHNRHTASTSIASR
jgi:5-methylcytosine-specific restriction protein A